MNKIFSVFAVLLLAVSPFVFAEEGKGDEKAVKAKGLDVRSAHLSCAVELTKAHLDVLASYAQKDVAALKADLDVSLSAAKDAAAALDRAKFDESAKAVRDNVKKGKEAVVESRKAGDLKGDNAKKARADLKVAQDAYKECVSQAIKKEGDQKVSAAVAVIDKFQKTVDELKANGADVTALQASLDSAKAAKDVLATAVASGDQKTIRDAMVDLRDLSLHIHANTQITRLRNVIAKAEERAVEKNVTVDFSQAKAELDNAAALAASGRKYGEGEFEKVWSSIKEAAQKLKGGVKAARKQVKEERKAEKAAQKEARKVEIEEKKAAREEKKAEKAAQREEKAGKDKAESEDEESSGEDAKEGGE